MAQTEGRVIYAPTRAADSTTALLAALERFVEASAQAKKRRKLGAVEAKCEKAVAGIFRAQGRAFAKAFARFKSSFKEASLEGDAWLSTWESVSKAHAQAFIKAIEDAAGAGLAAGAEEIIAGAGVDVAFRLDNPRALAYLDGYGADMVSRIDDTTRAEIKGIVEQAMREGWSYGRTAKEIAGRFSQFAVGMPQQHIASRAHLVAITEAGNAYCAGNLAAAEMMAADYGWDMEKSWLSSGDARVSAGCRQNAAAGWIPIGAKFPASGTYDGLRPLRFPGCRCDLLIRRKLAESGGNTIYMVYGRGRVWRIN